MILDDGLRFGPPSMSNFSSLYNSWQWINTVVRIAIVSGKLWDMYIALQATYYKQIDIDQQAAQDSNTEIQQRQQQQANQRTV